MFFGEVRLLHNFFARLKVRREYSGTNIPRLIETRWSGHLYAIQSIRRNYEEILSTLEKIEKGDGNNFQPIDIAQAAGILRSVKQRNFIFMLHFLNGLLSTLDPANKILQKRDIGCRQAMPVIEAVFDSVQRFRSDESYDRFIESTENTIDTVQQSSRLSDSIVMETLGEGRSGHETLKSVYLEVVDYVSSEMRRRFHENSDILIAISEINSIGSRDFNKVLPEIGLVLPQEAELNIVQTFLARETAKKENENTGKLKLLLPVKEAFPQTYRLFEASETFGSSTAVNECSFSALARIDTIRRMCMTDGRLGALSFMAFEKKKLSSITTDTIMRKFSESNRRIQLF